MIAGEDVKERVRVPLSPETLNPERIAYLEGLVSQARTAAAVFTQFTQEDVDRIVKPMVLAGLEQAQYLARLAVEETRLGVLEDKAIKNMVATRVRLQLRQGQTHGRRDSRVSRARTWWRWPSRSA